MSFFARLFKRNEPKNLEAKIQSISRKSSDECLEIVARAKDVPPRVAAIRRLADSDTLLRLASQEESQQIETAARKRLGELLDSGQLTLEELTQKVKEEEHLFQICAFSRTAGSRLLESITDENLLLQLAQNAGTTQLRQLAAEKIESRVILEKLEKTARAKDKAVLKIARRKLQVFKNEIAEQTSRNRQIKLLCQQMEQLANRDPDSVFEIRCRQLEESWALLSGFADEQDAHRFALALSVCQGLLQKHAANIRDEQVQLQEVEHAQVGLQAALINLQLKLAELYQSAEPDPATGPADTAALKSAWQSALDSAASQGLDVRAYRQMGADLCNAIDALLQQLAAHGPLEQLSHSLLNADLDGGKLSHQTIKSMLGHARLLRDVPTPSIITETEKLLAEWRNHQHEHEDRSRQDIREIGELVRRGQWAVSRGFISRSNAILRDLEDKLSTAKDIPASVATKIESFRSAVKKLGDWQDFAVTPKKQTLIRQMEELVESKLRPLELSTRIQHLQQEWRNLSKGPRNNDDALWTQFHNAAEKAYEPCKLYFAEQASVREENAAKRTQLIEQLQRYHDAYDWGNANWPEVEKTLRMAREAWQSHWPVPRKLIKPLQQQFDEILENLFTFLHREYDRNKEKKKALVDRAELLAGTDNTYEAITEAKQLQSQWRTVGPCRRKDDQALWKKFRAHCDAIFERRQQESESSRQERNEARSQAELIIDQLENLLYLSGEAFLIAKTEIDELTRQFQEIGELPKEDSKRITQKFYAALDRIQAKTAQEKSDTKKQQWRQALVTAEALRHYELALSLEEDTEFLQEQAQRQLDAGVHWPVGVHDILQKRFERAAALTEEQRNESLKQLHELCIRSEIATDTPTPACDSGLRMSYQVGQLQVAMGQQRTDREVVMAEIIREWLAVPGIPDEEYQDLLARLDACWELKIAAPRSMTSTV